MESLNSNFGYLHSLRQALLVDRELDSDVWESVVHIFVGRRRDRGVVLGVLVILCNRSDAMSTRNQKGEQKRIGRVLHHRQVTDDLQ